MSVEANNSKQVFDYAEQHYNGRVSVIYPASIFKVIKEHYPVGCLDEVSLISNQTDAPDSIESTNQLNHLYSPFTHQIVRATSKAGIY